MITRIDNMENPELCDRCDNPITGEAYYWDDSSYCNHCMAILEVRAEAAWEAQKEEAL